MAQPTADIHICNLALDRLGQRAISNLSEPSTDAEYVCARHFDQTRRELLREFIFPFSKKLVLLTASTEVEPAFGFETAYALPNDFIRLRALGDTTINDDTPPGLYDLVDSHIYTGEGDDDGLQMTYTYDARNVSKYDPLFVSLLKLKLAQNMAYKFTLKTGLLTQINAEYEALAARAQAINGQEAGVRRVERSKWVAQRRSGGSLRDNTRLP